MRAWRRRTDTSVMRNRSMFLKPIKLWTVEGCVGAGIAFPSSCMWVFDPLSTCCRSICMFDVANGRVVFSLSGRWRIVRLFNMRIFDVNEKDELGCMGNDRDEQHTIARSHHRDTVVSGVSYRVHRVRSHLEDSIEGQFLVNQVEEISPIPCIVLH